MRLWHKDLIQVLPRQHCRRLKRDTSLRKDLSLIACNSQISRKNTSHKAPKGAFFIA